MDFVGFGLGIIMLIGAYGARIMMASLDNNTDAAQSWFHNGLRQALLHIG